MYKVSGLLKYFYLFFLLYYFLTEASPFSSPPLSPSTPPSPSMSPPFPQKRANSQEFQPNTAHQVAIRLGAPSYQGWTRQPSRGTKAPKEGKCIRSSPSPFFRSSTKHKATQLWLVCRGSRIEPHMFPDYWFSLCEPSWDQVWWFCGFSCGVLDPSGFYNPFSPFCRIHWVLPSVCFYQLLGGASLMAIMPGSCLCVEQNTIRNHFFSLISGSCLQSYATMYRPKEST